MKNKYYVAVLFILLFGGQAVLCTKIQGSLLSSNKKAGGNREISFGPSNFPTDDEDLVNGSGDDEDEASGDLEIIGPSSSSTLMPYRTIGHRTVSKKNIIKTTVSTWRTTTQRTTTTMPPTTTTTDMEQVEIGSAGGDTDDEDDIKGSGDDVTPYPKSQPTPPRKGLTDCQRKRESATRSASLGAMIFQCTKKGDYKPLQCHHDRFCFCVNVRGQPLNEDRVPPGTYTDLDCERFRYNPPKERTPVRTQRPTTTPDRSDNELPFDETGRRGENEVEPRYKKAKKGENDAVKQTEPSHPFLSHPGIMAGLIGGAVVGLLLAILLVMFLVYRLRKRDSGSYPMEDTDLRSKTPMLNTYRIDEPELYA